MHKNASEKIVCEMAAIYPGGDELMDGLDLGVFLVFAH